MRDPIKRKKRGPHESHIRRNLDNLRVPARVGILIITQQHHRPGRGAGGIDRESASKKMDHLFRRCSVQKMKITLEAQRKGIVRLQTHEGGGSREVQEGRGRIVAGP